jgi:hypothetical protein
MTPLFNTRDYEFAHGKKPRGDGWWAFVPADYVWKGDMPSDGIAWVGGTFSEAKREVAKRHPAIDVWSVLS